MRVVFENQTVTPKGMPQNARHSYFRNCTIEGDMKKRDFSWSDFVDCTITANFRDTIFHRAESLGSNWDDAVLPHPISSFNRDIYLAHIKQRRPLLDADVKIEFDFIDTQIKGDFLSSWSTILPDLLVRAGTMQNFVDWTTRAANVLYADEPFLMKRHEEEIKSMGTPGQKMIDAGLTVTGAGPRYSVSREEWSPAMKAAHQLRDRWRLSRATEKFLNARHPELAPWIVWWEHLFPTEVRTARESNLTPEWRDLKEWGR